MLGQFSTRKDDAHASGEAHDSLTRKDQDRATTKSSSNHGAPTSFFLATEDMLSKSQRDSSTQGVDSTFGIRSISDPVDNSKQDTRLEQESTEISSHPAEEDHARRRSTLRADPKSRDPSTDGPTTYGKDNGTESPSFGFPRLSSALPSVSSFSQDSQGVARSLPSSPKSTSSRSGRPVDEDSVSDGGSQAIASSEDEAEADQARGVVESAPQLIMPSIQMPSRRPFTDRGKETSRVKILIAGDSGKSDSRTLEALRD